MDSKIFGIGLSRSGTSSLTEALRILGYTAIHSPTTLQQIRKHQAATDAVIADNFERLDHFFPGSKYIYTIRSRDAWLDSCEKFWLLMKDQFDNSFLLTELHKHLYGTDRFDRKLFAEAYERHSARVELFFKHRNHDLLILKVDILKDKWSPLCEFLSRPAPAHEFPRSHGMQLIETCLRRLLSHYGNTGLVAELSGASTDFLTELQKTPEAPRSQTAVEPEGSVFVRNLTARTCAHEGSVSVTARILGLSREYVHTAIEHRKSRQDSWLRKAKRWIKR
ncbi:hypothetical protein L0222_28610 [bacterium]|nr:hypothetical protein [bacterium]MCI0606476.1 hypothetical protein [bacterium]